MKSASSPIEKCSVPPGPSDKYDSATDLFVWLKENFKRFGDIYRASVFGADVYVVSAPEYCERILRHNWRNYLRKGLVVQRIALALGNNLITSNGEAWSSQRRMIQPAFTKSAIHRSINMMVEVNTELLEEWREAAKQGKTVNATRDVSLVVLKITLKSIFGEDYDSAASHSSSLCGRRSSRLKICRIPWSVKNPNISDRAAYATGKQNVNRHSGRYVAGVLSGQRQAYAGRPTGE